MWGHRAASWALALRPKKSCGPAQRLPNAALWTCVLPAASPAPGAQLLTPRTAGSPEGLVRGCQVVPHTAERPGPRGGPRHAHAHMLLTPAHTCTDSWAGEKPGRDALTCKRAE